jgi:hypothetical protein
MLVPEKYTNFVDFRTYGQTSSIQTDVGHTDRRRGKENQNIVSVVVGELMYVFTILLYVVRLYVVLLVDTSREILKSCVLSLWSTIPRLNAFSI